MCKDCNQKIVLFLIVLFLMFMSVLSGIYISKETDLPLSKPRFLVYNATR